MPLNLTISPDIELAIGEVRLRIQRTSGPNDFSVIEQHSRKEFDISPEQWTEIVPDCFVRSTVPRDIASLHNKFRVSINAPGRRVTRHRIERT